jgi:hypothetical protein
MVLRRNGIVLLTVMVLCGCSANKASYIGTGAVLGGGAGYAINEDGKDAAIGGLVGGIAGAVVSGINEKNMDKKTRQAYAEGYNQAQVEMATEYWEENTGKPKDVTYRPKLKRMKVEEQESNGVKYKEHYETVEVYQ